MTRFDPPPEPDVLLRIDGGGHIGFGHLKRCLSLARVLRDRHRLTTVFACRSDAMAHAMIESDGFENVRLDEGASLDEDAFLAALASAVRPRLLLVDHPHEYRRATFVTVRAATRLVVVQAEYEAAWTSDLLVFPAGHHPDNVVEQCERLHSEGMQSCLIGLDYVMLSDEARNVRIATERPYVALAAGGSDPHRLLDRWIAWLDDADLPIPVTALVGAGARRNFRRGPSSSSQVSIRPFTHEALFSAHLAVVAFGVTAYELVFHGIPALTAGYSGRTTAVSDLFASRYGATRSIGDGRIVGRDAFISHVRNALSPSEQARLRAHQRGLIDGRGAERIAAAIMRDLVRED